MTSDGLDRLLSQGKDIYQRDGVGMTALMRAARSNPNPQIHATLLKAGANTALRGVDGRRAVEFVADNPALLGTLAADRLRGR